MFKLKKNGLLLFKKRYYIYYVGSIESAIYVRIK